MIINGNRQTRSPYIAYLILGLSLCILLFIKLKNNPQSISKKTISKDAIFCDLETISEDKFKNGNHYFSGIETRSDEESNSGKYASKLDGTHNKGIAYRIQNPSKGARYKVEIWSYNPHPVSAFLAVTGKNKTEFYKEINRPVERRGDYWERWELYFSVPEIKSLDVLEVFVYKKEGKNPIYFDDLKITLIDSNFDLVTESFIPKTIQLTIDKEGVEKLRKNKKKSIAQGLVYHDENKVKAKILDNGKNKKVKIRHKGDWLDHMGKHPSYRVETESEESWNGMQSFSVQEPSTRGFLREWTFFRFLDYADVIRPRYDFINFQENNAEQIVFCYEEHFSKNLVENAKRREGPIVKMTEDRLWEIQKRTIKTRRWDSPEAKEKDKAYWASELRAFKEGKFKKNAKLLADFQEAQNLLYQYKYNLKPAADLFDVKRMAKYLAMVDICLAHHATTWHNQRFYYNPVTAVLEPIAFDAYGPENPESYAMHIYSEKLYTSNGITNTEPIDGLFYDDEFVRAYFKYLNKYSKSDFVESVMDKLEEEIVPREKFIRQRFSKYSFDRESIKIKAAKIQIGLPAHISSLQAFLKTSSKTSLTVQLINQHGFPLEVISGQPVSGESRIIYPNIQEEKPRTQEWSVPLETKQIEYRIPGVDSIYSVTILDWTAPNDFSSRQNLLDKKTSYSNFDFIKSEDNIVEFVGDIITISEPVVIPKNKRVIISKGQQIVFKDKGMFLSYSPIFMEGTETQPIKISSDDGINGSFSIIQAEGKSKISHTIFSNQNTLEYMNWKLTGSVNFYESDVDISNTVFDSNNCEDALNIIRSTFLISDSKFSRTFGDAFDADFCTGEVIGTSFVNIGNDAIDVSGSELIVRNTKINTTGDKGISAGENSKVTCYNTTIAESVIAVASKDKSKVDIEKIDIKNCHTGFAAFQKKPEFGPATITLQNFKFTNVKNQYMIEDGSSLDTNDQ